MSDGATEHALALENAVIPSPGHLQSERMRVESVFLWLKENIFWTTCNLLVPCWVLVEDLLSLAVRCEAMDDDYEQNKVKI